MTTSDQQAAPSREQTRLAVIETASRLLREGGRAAVTTRAVAAAAGVQAPTLYRLFGDKDGLLDAVAEHTFATYVADKASRRHDEDALVDLRSGWHAHIDFCLANPAVFALLVDPERTDSPATATGVEVLRARVNRVAATGRLRVPEALALDLIQAAGTGTILALLSAPAEQRSTELSDTMYDAVLRTILTDAPEPSGDPHTAAAVALRAAAPELTVLTPGERDLLVEWLDRIAGS